MEKFVERTLLYDFYGELLTEHQRSVYEDAVFDDLSLSEIARDKGISRQGIHDLIKRCDKLLSDYEERLHLVERFLKIKEDIQKIKELTKSETDGTIETKMEKINSIASDILNEL